MATGFAFPYSAAQALRDLVAQLDKGRNSTSFSPQDYLHQNASFLETYGIVDFPTSWSGKSYGIPAVLDPLLSQIEAGGAETDLCRTILTSWMSYNRQLTSADWMDIPLEFEATLTIMNGEGLCEIIGVRFRWRKAARDLLIQASVWDENGFSDWDIEQIDWTKSDQVEPQQVPEIVASIPETVKQTLLKEKIKHADQPFEFIRRISAYYFNGQWLDIPRADGGMTLSLTHAVEVSKWLESIQNTR